MSTPTLLLIGSGPGIGLATAILFAQKKFNKVALLARDATRLESEKEAVETAVSDRKVDVKTWSVDVTQSEKFKKVLAEVGSWGDVTCVVYNSARVRPGELWKETEEEILKDFMVNNIALYTASQWAFPILSKKSVDEHPSFLVTSSMLWKDAYPPFFSLSMAKAAQRNLVDSLAKTFPAVHAALLNVAGQVSPKDEYFSPKRIAEKYWELYAQEKSAWTFDLDVLGA